MANIAKGNIANALHSLSGVLGTSDQILDESSGKTVEEKLSDIPEKVWEKGSGNNSIKSSNNSNNTAEGNYSLSVGYETKATGPYSTAEGVASIATAYCSHSEGNTTTAKGNNSHSEGFATETKTDSEHASGRYNKSEGSNNFRGDKEYTLFTVGNGYDESKRHNALAIMQSGDAYISDTEADGQYYEKPMIHLQKDLARVNGKYSDLTAGHAVNLDGTTDIVSDSAYRPTGGDEDVLYEAASIQNIKGNAIAWNQLVKNGNFANGVSNWNNWGNNISTSVSDNVITITRTGEGDIRLLQTIVRYDNFIGHKYLLTGECNRTDIDITFRDGQNNKVSNTKTNVWERLSIINQPSLTTGNFQFSISAEGQYRNCQVFDLTLIYGAGNEPTTPEQFEADYQRWFGRTLEYEEYDAGSIRPVLATGIKTVGFNLYSGGDFEGKLSTWYNKNDNILWNNNIGYKGAMCFQCNLTYTKVEQVEDTKNEALIRINYADDSSAYLYMNRENNTNLTFITDSKKTVKDIRGSYSYCPTDIVKLSNICINFVWSGKRDGDYEPHWEETESLPITTLTGKLNGKGLSVAVFPDGLKRAGDVYDEINVENGKTKAIKRIGSVDLGTFDFDYQSDNIRFLSRIAIQSIKHTPDNLALNNKKGCELLSYRYNNIYMNKSNATLDKVISETNGRIAIRDNSFDENAIDLKKSLQGVILYYELAEPEEYIIDDFELPVIYKIDDFGTEQIVQPTNSITPIITSTYGLNAVDSIRRMSSMYAKKSELDGLAKKVGDTLTNVELIGNTAIRQANVSVGEGTKMTIEDGASLNISDGSNLNIKEDSSIKVLEGSIDVEEHGELNINSPQCVNVGTLDLNRYVNTVPKKVVTVNAVSDVSTDPGDISNELKENDIVVVNVLSLRDGSISKITISAGPFTSFDKKIPKTIIIRNSSEYSAILNIKTDPAGVEYLFSSDAKQINLAAGEAVTLNVIIIDDYFYITK